MKKYVLACMLMFGAYFNESVFSYQDTASITQSIKDAANEDKVSNEDLAIFYSVYKGTYLYGTKFDFNGDKDFGVVFDKQRAIKAKLAPENAPKLGALINSLFLKYETLPFDDNNKNKFLEECNKVSEGIKAGID